MFAATLAPDTGAAKAVPRHAYSVGKHRHASLTGLRILVRPEQGAGREIDRDDGAGAGRADEHSLGQRGREASEPAEMAVTIVDRPLLIDFGERLRPLQSTGVAIEHIQPNLPLLFDEHKQLLSHGQWSSEIPGRGRGRQHRVIARTTAGGKPPPQATAIGDVVGGDRVAPLPAAGRTHAHPLHRRSEVHAPGLRRNSGIGMALDHKHQPTIARHGSARGVVEDAGERAAGIGIGRVASTVTPDCRCLQRSRARPGLQPDPLAGFEVNRQQAHGGAHKDHAVHCQRRASRQHRDLLLGMESPLRIELP